MHPVHEGEGLAFKFNVFGENSSCTDARGNEYPYACIDNLASVDDYANACINAIPSYLAEQTIDIDYNCISGACDW